MDTVLTIPTVLSPTGVIPETLHRALSTLDLLPNTFIQLQKATILNTCHNVRNVLTSLKLLSKNLRNI